METDLFKFTLVLVIGVSVMVSEMYKQYLRSKTRQPACDAKSQLNADSQLKTELMAQNQALKARVEVLERLVTEDSFELKQQFKHL
ncbi:hypothetical protein [Shewanella sp. SR44-3]|uniref:hypothetical protein n=1 Tax=unclassified Shewanella TaxID=196818 RepID=UPI0015F9C999|nr:hypothetical protein [Shewanella sp. SR44-3]MBB1268470.1 hypothetical protein [Shewanella sp. SR44-3]